MGATCYNCNKVPLTGATMLNLFMPRAKHFKKPVVDKLYSLNVKLFS